MIVTEPHTADVIHTLSWLLIQSQRTLFHYKRKVGELEKEVAELKKKPAARLEPEQRANSTH